MTGRRASVAAAAAGALGIALAVALALALVAIPADDFVFVPRPAKPHAGQVTVEGARPVDRGRVYNVDVFVRR
ncbi:MAG: hypothetical protein RMM28_08890, partial [Thermoleophilia bacterium]|nr:hypothetical protein [Thermoleophilia bacterium]